MWDKFEKVLKVITPVVTAILAVFAFIFDQRQRVIARSQNEIKAKLDAQGKELENRTQRESITQTYADKIFAHLSDLKLDTGDHAGMVIDLFDMITEANINAESFRNPERQQLMPLRMALLTGNDDILTNIGFATEKRKMWLEFARQSRNDKVRSTALKTLGKIGLYARGESQIPDLCLCISAILEISEGFRRVETYDAAREAIDRLTDVIVREPILLDDNELARLFKEVTLRLASARSEMLRQSPTKSTTNAPDPSRTSYRLEGEGPRYLTVANSESRPAQILLAADMRKQLRETDITLEKLGKLNLYEQSAGPIPTPSKQSDAATNEFLKKLYSGNAKDRLEARAALASQGATSLQALLKMLQMWNLEPRLKVNLSYALCQMPQSVVITDARDVQLLTGLLGDEQAEVRSYVSEFLMKLTDGPTIRALHPKLLEIPRDDASKTGDAVYNAIVVLGTWMRVLPPELDDVKREIRKELNDLGQQFSAEEWKRTRQLISEMNALNQPR